MMSFVWLLGVVAVVAFVAYVRAGLLTSTALLAALLAGYWITSDAHLAWNAFLALLLLPLLWFAPLVFFILSSWPTALAMVPFPATTRFSRPIAMAFSITLMP